MNLNTILFVVIVIAVIVLLYFIGSSLSLWVQALVSGARVGLFNIIFMRFRKVPPKLIVESKIMAVKAGIDIGTDELESHYLAGGNVMRVIQAPVWGSGPSSQASASQTMAMMNAPGVSITRHVATGLHPGERPGSLSRPAAAVQGQRGPARRTWRVMGSTPTRVCRLHRMQLLFEKHLRS